ncbi:MAG: carboxypeptidase-like regulatory domain-containing protein, partial [Planctomycetota bacterium]
MFPSVTFRSSGQIYTLADSSLLHDQISEGRVGRAEASSALALWVARRGSVPLREFLHDANGRSSQGLQSLTDEEVLDTVRTELNRRIGARFVVLRGMSYLQLRRPSGASGDGGNATIDPPPPNPGGGDPDPVTKATLTVEVVDGEGQPLTTADVTLNGSQKTRSDGGSAVYEDLSAGRYRAKAELEGYSDAESEVDVASGESKSIQLTLRKLKAVLIWPTNGADHKQYVNLDAADSNPEFGKQIPVKIKVEGAKAGDKVYIKSMSSACA